MTRTPVEPPWFDIDATDIEAGDPCPPATARAIRDLADHLERWMGKDFTAAQDHVHDGTDSKLPSHGVTWNLFSVANLGWSGIDWWQSAANAAVLASYWEASAALAYSGADGIKMTGLRGQYISMRLGPLHGDFEDEQHFMFGGGKQDLVLSFYVLLKEASTTGKLDFGFTDNSFDTFISGGQGRVDYSDLSATTWTRVWMPVSGMQSPNGTWLPRILWRVEEDFAGSLAFGGFMLTPGLRLMPFFFGLMEDKAFVDYTSSAIASDIPVWDRAVSLTNAVEVKPS